MRIACFAVLFCLALAACDRAPTFDASSLPAYQKSLGAINAQLSGKDQRKLRLALLTLAAGSAAEYTAFGLSNPDAPADIEALDGVANPLMFLDRMRPSIAGRTAAAVIRRVADDLDLAIARAERQAGGADKVLAAFVIDNPRYSWNQGSRFIRPTLDFSIYNGSKEPISAIRVTATLTTSDNDAPLVVGDVVYHFADPLQPGVQRGVEVWVPPPGPWTAKRIETAGDTTNLTVKVSNVFKANGTRLLATDVGWLDVMRKKRDFLRS
jgi:hypothetical protein